MADDHTWDLGPQYKGDDPWRARMRRHQSWWRATELRVDCGVGPRSTSTSRYGNFLTIEDGLRGSNFLTPEIHAVAEARIAAGAKDVEPFRCRCNLLSSQPMAFNLFGPAAADPELATRLVASLAQIDAAEVDEVRIEWAPSPKREYLDDGSSFDAFFGVRDPQGRRIAIGIECKLTEPFSPKVDRAEKYLPLTTRHPETWAPATVDQLPSTRWMQLWRNHLLLQALVDHPGSGYDDHLSLVVGHPADPSLAAAVAGYRDLLAAGGRERVRLVTVDAIVAQWRRDISGDDALERWLDSFSRRYVELELSA